ncbi:stage III sporulation protein AE [Scatolibacter rhodanostii]|uniref:stage III sporulation protein AE n=1 Tax=Scatolibacter rhodanostii TaxID=2014781 RepID=UPI0013562E92|nr:hypothetical protein [Scatolibacter rhodanostii]
MKKKVAGIFVILILFFCSCQTVYAEEIKGEEVQENLIEKSGAAEMYDSLEEDVKENLGAAGIHSSSVGEDMSFERLLQAVSKMLQENMSAPIKAILAILVVVMICRLAESFENDGVSQTVSMLSAVTAAGIIIVPIIRLISSLKTVVDTASVFLLTSVPVYAGLLMASGNVKTGASYTAVTLAAGNAIPVLSSAVIIPLLNIFLALAIVSSVSEIKFHKMGESLYKFTKWALVVAVTLFTGALSLQTVIGSHLDGMSGKAAKLLVSSAIPVVGGAIGDSVSVLLSSVSMVKSGVGAFGILTSLMIFLPLLIEIILWSFVAGIGEITADLFEAKEISRFLASCGSVIKMMIAVLVSVCAVCIVSASIVISVKAVGT